jgi:hypothetical protein
MARQRKKIPVKPLTSLLSTALDRMKGCLLTTTSSRVLIIKQATWTGITWSSGETYIWNPGDPLLFIGTEHRWTCDDGARRRGHLTLMTNRGIAYLHPRELGPVKIFSESTEDAED